MWTDSKRHLLWLVLLVAALVVVSIFFSFFRLNPRISDINESDVRVPPPAPVLTPERTIEAIGEKQFSALVSYTDQGFEPAQMTIAQGDTIRFTNNSTRTMTLSLENASHPPAGGLPPGEYWEYTSNVTGTIQYTELNTQYKGTISIQ